ncbi:MAG: imidazole glycerol phosphate synthase subunit HisH [Clostridia bacterium]|nr:imidazole glycerol phosphate synthase subunit HisH [Clostridia bacterium]
MIAVVDYGVGNLFSLCASLKYLNIESVVTADKELLKKANGIILPGVGAFGDAASKLRESGLLEFLRDRAKSGKPFLGICLGMQLLFDKSYEYGEHDGLGLIKGEVCDLNLDTEGLKVPQIGWNSLTFKQKDDPLMKYVKEGSHVYYVHSFYAKNCDESIVAYSNYGVDVPGVVRNKNVYGTQFHPEKSGEVGLNMLRAFVEIAEGNG